MLGRKPPQSKAKDLGERIHKELEDWEAHRDKAVLSPRARKLAECVENSLSVFSNSSISTAVEKWGKLIVPISEGSVRLKMRIDRIDVINMTAENITKVIVRDYKTTSNMMYALDEQTIKRDIQASVYTQWAREEYPGIPIVMEWDYVTTKGALATKQVIREDTPHVEDNLIVQMEMIKELLESMWLYSSAKLPQDKIPCHSQGCSAYGGCPHMMYCKRGTSMQFRKRVRAESVSDNVAESTPEKSPKAILEAQVKTEEKVAPSPKSAAETFLPAEGDYAPGEWYAVEDCVVGREYASADGVRGVYIGTSKNRGLFRNTGGVALIEFGEMVQAVPVGDAPVQSTRTEAKKEPEEAPVQEEAAPTESAPTEEEAAPVPTDTKRRSRKKKDVATPKEELPPEQPDEEQNEDQEVGEEDKSFTLYINCVPTAPCIDLTVYVAEKYQTLLNAVGDDLNKNESTKFGMWKHILYSMFREDPPTEDGLIFSGALADIAIEALVPLAKCVVRGI